MADEKRLFRSIIAHSREDLSSSRAAALSELIQNHLLRWDRYRAASAILLYAAHRQEAATDAIFAAALASGKAVFYPRLNAGRDRLEVIRITDRSSLRVGAYGILEPDGEETAAPEFLRQMLVCVPGVAFSSAGDRIGRGGGHYDRLLREISPPAISVGLAYSFQLLDELPCEAHDRRLDFVITESAIYPDGIDAPSPARISAEQGGPRWRY